MITLSTKQFWDKQQRDCNGALNFDPKGLSYPGTSVDDPNRGMRFVVRNGVTYLRSRIFKGMPLIGGSWRDEAKKKIAKSDKLFIFKAIIEKIPYLRNKRMLIAQWKPGANYPTVSLWLYDYKGAYWYGLNRAYNTSGVGNVKDAVDPNTGAKIISPYYKEILTPLAPVVFDKEVAYGFDMLWGWTNTAKTIVYIGKNVYNVGGANMDKPAIPGTPEQNPRIGIYNWNFNNDFDEIVMDTRDWITSDGLDGETIQQLMK